MSFHAKFKWVNFQPVIVASIFWCSSWKMFNFLPSISIGYPRYFSCFSFVWIFNPFCMRRTNFLGVFLLKIAHDFSWLIISLEREQNILKVVLVFQQFSRPPLGRITRHLQIRGVKFQALCEKLWRPLLIFCLYRIPAASKKSLYIGWKYMEVIGHFGAGLLLVSFSQRVPHWLALHYLVDTKRGHFDLVQEFLHKCSTYSIISFVKVHIQYQGEGVCFLPFLEVI